mgnify:CR=1 FL=1
MNDVTQRKVLGFISLCRRAGRLTTGMDAAVEKAEKGEAHLLLLAQDLAAHILNTASAFHSNFRSLLKNYHDTAIS